jgi:hypothetical protein
VSRRQRNHCTFPVTDAFAVGVNVHVFALFPPLEQAPDQTALRPPLTLSVIGLPTVNDADLVFPTLTLMPAGFEVILSPLRPLALTVNVSVPPGGGGGAAPCGAKLRALDHAPAVPAEFTARTRHQCGCAASEVALNCDAVTVCSTTAGAENELESSIWITYEAAPETSLQSSAAGSVTVLPFDGLSSDGAAGGLGGGGAVPAVTPNAANRIVSPSLAES